MATQAHRRSAALFRAIADPTRREILALLRGRRLTVNDIAGNFRCSRPAISRHLRRLRAVGLVRTEREGTVRICRLDAEPLRMVDGWLNDYRQYWRDNLRNLKRYVEEEAAMDAAHAIEAIVEQIVVNAPADRVFAALADPAQRVRWWGVKGRFETEHMDSDLRAGGRWVMRGTGVGGRPFEVHGVYQAVDRPRLLAFTWRPDWDEQAGETLVRFDLDERDGVTHVRLTHSGFRSQGSRDRHQGWPQVLSWLKGYAEQR